jgi:hypothetical protein
VTCPICRASWEAARVAQVVEGQLHIRVIDRPLEDLAIRLEDGGPDWLGLPHNVAYRPL